MPKLHRRCLEVAAASLVLLSSCGESSRTPSALRQFPADVENAAAAVSGIYTDGWMAETASANLHRPNGDQVLSIRGTIPRISNPDFVADLTLQVDNVEVARQSLRLGEFQVAAPVNGPAGPRRVTVTFSAAQELPGGDGRMVGAHLSFLGFEPAKSAAGVSDIVRGPNLRLGDGWGPLETFKGEHFRWVENDAQIVLTSEKAGSAEISLRLEAGPGVGAQCVVKAFDASGRQVAMAAVKKRQTIKLRVPVNAGRCEFKLHVDGGGKKIAADPRILNFRVFELASSGVAERE